MMGTMDAWSSIETIIRERLDLMEIDRRYCVICGRQGPSLSRCFGCQMVYYCGEEHQFEDWSSEHGQKCAQLEWVALGEFIRALPAQPPLPELGDKWPVPFNNIHNWKQWFSIRTEIIHSAHNTANVFHNLVHSTDKRQPTYQNAVDGLLAAVTDLLTYVLTIGKAIVSFGLQPHQHSLCVQVLHGFNKIDFINSEQSGSNLPTRFHELLNMFPDNRGVELIIVIDDDDGDDDDDTDQSSLPQANLKPDRLIITTRGKGYVLDTINGKRLQQTNVDLLVYFNAAHLFLTSNNETLKLMLSKQRPILLTFEDEDEFHLARNYCSNSNLSIIQAGSNPFGSLMIRQRFNRPNSTHSTNSYQILLNRMTANGLDERLDDKKAPLYRQRSHQSSIGIQHGSAHLQHQQQLNPGLKQLNGKIHIESHSLSTPLSHNTQANNNETLRDANARKVSIVNTANTTSPSNTTTTVQPAVRPNNHMRQPTIAQRQQYVPVTAMTNSRQSEPHSSTDGSMQKFEINKPELKPQPKPRLSLVKSTSRDFEVVKPPSPPLQTPSKYPSPSYCTSPPPPPSVQSSNLVQFIKPFFEKSSPEVAGPRTNRSIASVPQTYQSGASATKVTCLDDLISAKSDSDRSASPIVTIQKQSNNDRIVTAVPVASVLPQNEAHHDRSYRSSQPITKPISSVKQSLNERSAKINANPTSVTSSIPIEIQHDQRSIIDSTSVASPVPSSLSSNRIEERFNESSTKQNIVPIKLKTIETKIDEPVISSIVVTPPTSPRLRPKPIQLPLSSVPANSEVIYTEVIKNHERQPTSHKTDSMKAPLSPSRSFIIPTKSPSISSKNSSFNLQRASRPTSTNNFSLHTQKSRTNSTTMAADRISLYSQRSYKQADVGVTIKNLSECIDRVGVVFDETNRTNETSLSGLTTVDLIREQLNSSSAAKQTESLLDKLYKSNSSTRLSNGAARKTFSVTTPRSKSQQATRNQHESQTESKTIPKVDTTPPASSNGSQTVRRSTGVSLPVTPKPVQESEPKRVPTATPSPTLFYQNLNPLLPTIESSSGTTTSVTTKQHTYALKQPTGPICNGVPRPFRKPTAIIEPSPVIPVPLQDSTEPNYVNLPSDNTHIYTNEQETPGTMNSNSNSYTSKTSSIYSTSEKVVPLETLPEPVYAVVHANSTNHQQQSTEYDSFDDELADNQHQAQIEKPFQSQDNTDDDSFDDDDDDDNVNQSVNHSQHSSVNASATTRKNASTGFFRSTLNRLTRSNKSLDRVGLTNESTNNETIVELNPLTNGDTKIKKTLRSIKARHEAKKTGNLGFSYNGEEDTTSIDSNCSTQTATSLNKSSKSANQRFRLFRRKIEKEFASDTEAEKHQTEQRRKKWNSKMLHENAEELKTKRLLMMSDEEDDDNDDQTINGQEKLSKQQRRSTFDDEPHIYDHIVNEDSNNNNSRMGKLTHETHTKSPTITLDEIRSEIQAEIAARQELNTTNNNNSMTKTPMNSSNSALQKKRSKSVTFLDELLVDDSRDHHSNSIRKPDGTNKPAPAARRIEKGDARSICGALTGTGPIRGIIKTANNDITGTTAPVSPSAAAAIYLSGTTMDTRCTSPKVHERTPRPLSTYTVGSARFYDGPASSVATASNSATSTTSVHTSYPSNLVSNQRPILNTSTTHSSSDSTQTKRPTAKVSPFQTKSPNELASSPVSPGKSNVPSSNTKKPIRSFHQKPANTSHDTMTIPNTSISEGVGGVSKRLQSNF